MNDLQTKRLLTFSSIRDEYGLPRDTIEVAIAKRELNAYRPQGKTYYFKRDEFEAWFESKLANKPLLRSEDFVFPGRIKRR